MPCSFCEDPRGASACAVPTLSKQPVNQADNMFREPKLPFVFVNMAMTADGKIATADRTGASFGSPNDKRQLLLLRSKADAVMAGARTVDSNPVNLGPGPAEFRRLRSQNGFSEYNLRVIVSGSGSIHPGAEVFRHRFSPIIVLTTELAAPTKLKRLRSVADEVKIVGRREIDFVAALRWLREKWQVNRLLCEGGGELNSALFAAGLVNELHLTVCPMICGGRQAPTIADGTGAKSLADATQMELTSMKMIEQELFLVFAVKAHKADRDFRQGARARDRGSDGPVPRSLKRARLLPASANARA